MKALGTSLVMLAALGLGACSKTEEPTVDKTATSTAEAPKTENDKAGAPAAPAESPPAPSQPSEGSASPEGSPTDR